jgi:hypothetical protein
MSNLLTFLVALCLTEFVHNAIEIWGMRQKVHWLELVLQGRQPGRWPIDINSKTKTVALHAIIWLLLTGLFGLLLTALKPANNQLVVIGLAVLVINYAFTTWKVDCFHVEIGRLISQAKARK